MGHITIMIKLTPKRLILFVLGAAMLLFLSSRATAGDFTYLPGPVEDPTYATFSYTGEVNAGDSKKLVELFADTDKTLVIVIDSPGGSAYDGIDLYWTAKRLGIKTVAGSSFGAYSAAAIFWLGGSADMIEGSIAGFHLAYYTSWNPPGGDTADIDGEFFKILVDAFGRHEGAAFWVRCQAVLDAHGTNGFVLLTMKEGIVVEESAKLLASKPTFPRIF